MSQVRLLLADEQTICLAALQSLLAKEFDVVGATSTTSRLIAEVERLTPQVLLARISFHDQEVFRTVKTIHLQFPRTHIVVLAAERGERACQQALSCGASACVHADDPPEALMRAIREVARKESAVNVEEKMAESALLTTRQRQILAMIIAGLPQKEIGARLHVSPKTVEFHKYRMMRLLGVKSSAELIVAAVRLGLANDR